MSKTEVDEAKFAEHAERFEDMAKVMFVKVFVRLYLPTYLAPAFLLLLPLTSSPLPPPCRP